MLLVSLAHQFIWRSFTLVFTRNATLNEVNYDKYLDNARQNSFQRHITFRAEPNQTSKVEGHTGKIAN